MFIDNSIILREDLPKALKRDFEELQSYYDAGDEVMFDVTLDGVEATVKSYYHVSLISREELNMIFRKYGMG